MLVNIIYLGILFIVNTFDTIWCHLSINRQKLHD